MKKLFYFAAAAMMMAACTSEELNVQDQQKLAEDNAAVNFDVYTLRGVTRAGTPGDITNANIKDAENQHGKDGFGVFAYYTNGDTYTNNAIPNFMYNQKVKYENQKWVYEPVKYWPNEYGDAAHSEQIDYVTFFAYAPWTNLVANTGRPDTKGVADADIENYQNKNIVEVTNNKKQGDPIIKYVVDTDPATSVDLLWGVAAEAGTTAYYEPIANDNDETKINAGFPFINLVKPAVPQDKDGGKIKFNLRHALAKVKVTIDYIADDNTPVPSGTYDPTAAPNKINADQTRIYVRWIKMNGFALQGALNLNNEDEGLPNWKAWDGNNELNFEEITFNDGRKDKKEGVNNGEAKNEQNICLNPLIIENFCELDGNKFATYTAATADEEAKGKNPGVLPFIDNTYTKAQLLFGGDPNGENKGFFYVIPRGQKENVNIEIDYDVLTLDPNLSTTLSGTKDFGSEIENQISKDAIFGEGIDFEAGKQYEIHIHLGMTSVKIEAEVTDWDASTDPADVDLPDNQPEGQAEPASTGAHANDIVAGTVFKFSSQWDPDYTASARILSVNGDVVKVKVTGSHADGTYFVKISDFGEAIQSGTTADTKYLNEDKSVPVYKNADDTTGLFNVTIKKNE